MPKQLDVVLIFQSRSGLHRGVLCGVLRNMGESLRKSRTVEPGAPRPPKENNAMLPMQRSTGQVPVAVSWHSKRAPIQSQNSRIQVETLLAIPSMKAEWRAKRLPASQGDPLTQPPNLPLMAKMYLKSPGLPCLSPPIPLACADCMSVTLAEICARTCGLDIFRSPEDLNRFWGVAFALISKERAFWGISFWFIQNCRERWLALVVKNEQLRCWQRSLNRP